MDYTETKQARYGAPGTEAAAPLARRAGQDVGAQAEPVGLMARTRRAFIGWLKTAAVTLGTMYVIGWFAVTMTVTWFNRTNPRVARWENTMQKEMRARAMRPYAAPVDPGISLARAGEAFLALQPGRTGDYGFTLRVPAKQPVVPWRGMKLDQDLFKNSRPSSYEGPSSVHLIAASKAGYSAREKAVLKMIGNAPIWRQWDIVARAPALDQLGARFELPFGADATIEMMPIQRFAATKELAYAAVARAAWHLSEGRRDSAEIVLRSIVSYGLLTADHGSWVIDQLIGNVITGIGRGPLIEFYDLTNDPRGREIERATAQAELAGVPAAFNVNRQGFIERRNAIANAIGSTDVPHAMRMEMLLTYRLNSCGDARELIFGPRPESREVFERARRDLARYPSERALIDLIESPREIPVDALGSGADRTVGTTMNLLGRVFFNPRLGMCTIAGIQGRQ